MTVSEKIEHLRQTCSTQKLAFVKDSGPDDLRAGVVVLKCNSWLCPDCAKRLSRRWAAAVMDYTKHGKWYLQTLTMPGEMAAQDTYSKAAAAWNRLRGALTKRARRKIKYVRVLEAQKSGRAHYHFLIDYYCPPVALKAMAEKAGFGYIADIRPITSTEAYSYVRKYLAKKWESEIGLQACVDTRSRRCSGARGFVLCGRSHGRCRWHSFNISASAAVNYRDEIVKLCATAGWQCVELSLGETTFGLAATDPDPGGVSSARWMDSWLDRELSSLFWTCV